MLFLTLLFAVSQACTDYKEIADVLVNDGINETGGITKEWVSKVAEAMQEYLAAAKKTTFQEPTDVSYMDRVNQYRKQFGPRSAVGSNQAEAPEELKNLAMEGDMILTPEQIRSFIPSGILCLPSDTDTLGNKTRASRAATTDPTAYWTVGTKIYYEIDSSLSSIADKVRAAVQFWNNNSCLGFKESSTERNRLRYYRGVGCSSSVGKQANWTYQDVSIGYGCESHGTICHETAHALGFFHTQSRYDRDYYLDVNEGNISPSLLYNFVKKTPQTETHFGLPYDYGSVMQYGPYAFAKDMSIPTSVAKDLNYQNSMGQREGPSFSDVREMNLLYKCADYCKWMGPISCQNNGIVNTNTCKECICPRYFSGTLCEKMKPGTAPVCTRNTIQATSSSFSVLDATVGIGMNYTFDDSDVPADCYWMIQAPSGRRLQVQVKAINSTCMESCPWGAFEINLGNIEQYGIITCCSSVTTQYFTSVAERVVIRGYSRYNNINMQLNYRVV